MRRSRLSKKTERKSLQTIVLSFLGIVIILFLLFRYGIPLLSDTSFLFGRFTNALSGSSKDQKSSKNEENYVPPPDLDSLPKATKEQNLKVSGTSLSGLTIQLYLNGRKEDETNVSDGGTFEFDVSLSEGENIIKARAIKNGLESQFSDLQVVIYKKEGPELSIESPKDGETITWPNPYNVIGKTDPDTVVTVNDFQAIISGDAFTYALSLKDGENEIKVVAVDLVGNKTEKTIHVNYSP